jgi:hypothetical protein
VLDPLAADAPPAGQRGPAVPDSATAQAPTPARSYRARAATVAGHSCLLFQKPQPPRRSGVFRRYFDVAHVAKLLASLLRDLLPRHARQGFEALACQSIRLARRSAGSWSTSATRHLGWSAFFPERSSPFPRK